MAGVGAAADPVAARRLRLSMAEVVAADPVAAAVVVHLTVVAAVAAIAGIDNEFL
jgi:hypothetical protein